MEFLIFLIGGLWLLIKCASESSTIERQNKEREDKFARISEYAHSLDVSGAEFREIHDEWVVCDRRRVYPDEVSKSISAVTNANPKEHPSKYLPSDWTRALIFANHGYVRYASSFKIYIANEGEPDRSAGQIEYIKQISRLLKLRGKDGVVFVRCKDRSNKYFDIIAIRGASYDADQEVEVIC